MLAIYVALGALLVGQSPAEGKKDLAAEVRQLVRELNAPEAVKRDAAQQKLVDLGPGVLEHLPVPTDRTGAEEKQRLGQVRDKLQRNLAEASVRATTVTLSGEMLLSEAFAAFQKQTGNMMIDHRENLGQEAGDPKVKCNFDKTPFWQAIDDVFDQAGLTVYAYPEKDGVAAATRPENEIPRKERRVAYAGAFRLEGMELTARRNLRDAMDRRLQLQMELSWEPRLEPITIEHELSDIVAVDEAGKVLTLENTEGVREAPINPGELTTEMLLPFSLPDRSVKSIASLKGKFTALVPGQVETFRFTDVAAKSVEQKKAGVAVVLDQVRKNGDVWEVRILVRFDKASGALESHRGWIFNNEAYFESADKQKVAYDGFETTRQTEDEVGVAYVFDLDKGPKGMTFVYKTPSVITRLPVEYEIKNLDLP